MKILFISTRQQYQTHLPCSHCEAMKKVGIEVYPFEYYIRFGLTIWNARNQTSQINQALIQETIKFKPDVILMFKCPEIQLQTLKTIKQIVNPIFVMWYGDYRDEIYGEIRERKDILDLLLIVESQNFDRYRNLGIKNVKEWHIGVDPSIHKRFSTNKQCEVMFCGGNFLNVFPLSGLRQKLIEKVNNRFNLEVYSHSNFGKVKPITFVADEKELSKVMSKAKILLGINHYNAVRFYTRRLWHCLATGRLHLTYYIPGMEKDFRNHKDLVWFKSIEEGLDLIEFYLKNETKREQIALQGQKLVYKKHTYEHRYKQLLKYIGGL